MMNGDDDDDEEDFDEVIERVNLSLLHSLASSGLKFLHDVLDSVGDRLVGMPLDEAADESVAAELFVNDTIELVHEVSCEGFDVFSAVF